MIRDRVIWGVCVGLFLAGGVFFRLSHESASTGDFKLVDWFSIISAVATAVAAIAACMAASVAKKQSFDAAVTTRWQMYKMHSDSFNAWLDGIEEDSKVKFFRRHELYDSIFPNNRDPLLGFTDRAGPELIAWQRSFGKLTHLACQRSEPEFRLVGDWVHGCMMLAGYMRYTSLSPEKGQIFLGGWIPTRVCLENYEKILPVMSQVLGRLSSFAFCPGETFDKGTTSEFKEGFKYFVKRVVNDGWDQHEYR
jgi:hypothetical protein